jgi:hypothetical protein
MSIDFREDSPAYPDFDSYGDEAHAFEREVYLLILNTLNAGLAHLSAVADKDMAEIKQALDKATDDEIETRLVDEHTGVISEFGEQERFLRNMALVALASRLTHTLRKMARSAEHFAPRLGRYRRGNESEFDGLWNEYKARFSIDFEGNADRIAFVAPMQKVRNQIVHDGGEANPFKAYSLVDFELGEDGYLDTSFSTAYPEFVSGTGIGAEVSVRQAKLDSMVESSIALVKWLAAELRRQECAPAEEGT